MGALDVTVTGLVLNFVRATYGAMPHGAKLLARDTACSPRAAENWLAGLNGPSVEPLADLLAAHPPLKQQFDDHIARRRLLLQRSAQAADRARRRLVTLP